MKLIVGLGNPGIKYKKTRHNIGFMIIDYYSKKNNLKLKEKFNGLYCETKINEEKVILLKPKSYMNNSGDVVKKYVDYYNIETKNILVFYDDITFEVGTFKIKKDGSSAGHNGINDIILKLATKDIQRVRIGAGKNNINLVNYVLGKIPKKDMCKINGIIPILSQIIDDFMVLNIEQLMQKYNKKEKNENSNIQ